MSKIPLNRTNNYLLDIDSTGNGHTKQFHSVQKFLRLYIMPSGQPNHLTMYKLFFIPFIFLLILSCSFAQGRQEKQLSKNLDELISQRLPAIAPGCVVLIVKKGTIIYRKAFGTANLELNVPMQPEMIFRTGSMGKQYTAIAILQLVEQGKIALQDSVQKYVRDFPSKGYTITIENLLTNTSGIKNYQEIVNTSNELINYTPKQGVDYFKNEPLEFKPGSQFKYSNSNFYLLGYIIELVTGKGYEEYLQQNVLNRAGLKSTYYIHPEKIIPNMASGYSRFDGKLENAILENVTTMYAAGALMANVDDLYKWHQALYSLKIVNKETLDKAFTPYKFADGSLSEYGYGWFVKNIDESKTIEHSGSTDGFQSDEIYLPDEDVFIATLFNCFEADMDWTILSNDIARLAIGKPLNNEVKLSEDILKQYVGAYVFNADHKLVVTLENAKLFIEDTNPIDRLPKVRLYAESENKFYMKEAELKFEFVKDTINNSVKIITYNNRGKDAEWIKAK
jgi:CubicO group peptidase (beta-lactamase class C family)